MNQPLLSASLKKEKRIIKSPLAAGQMDFRPQGAVLIATLVVVNFIWWMVMIVAIGVGATHLNNCPVQPNIPIYLIVMGATSILSLSVTYNISKNKESAINILLTACMTVLHIFSFSWLIAGTCWVYNIYPPNYSGTDNYCHMITYQFAFVVTTLLWVAMTIVFICGCCFGLLTCCTTMVVRRNLIPSRRSFYGATSDLGEQATGDV
ncbi:transmembrane protein 272-like [Menidia menidia]